MASAEAPLLCEFQARRETHTRVRGAPVREKLDPVRKVDDLRVVQLRFVSLFGRGTKRRAIRGYQPAQMPSLCAAARESVERGVFVGFRVRSCRTADGS